MPRTAPALLALVIVLTACGENPIERAGQGSTDWIGAAAPSTRATVPVEIPTTTRPQRPTVDLIPATGLGWINDELDLYIADTPDGVAGLVWEASSGVDTYVQAHRTSVARALPGVKFPAAVPENVAHVTSQLVFSTPSGAMDEEWLAAFGFWSVIPYTQSRAVGQSVVLRVGRSYRPLDGVALTGCAVLLLGEALGCSDVIVAGLGMATEVTVAEGVKLMWTDGDYRYELFYRTAQNPEVAGLMAGSMVELTDLESRAVLAFQGVVARMPVASPPPE